MPRPTTGSEPYLTKSGVWVTRITLHKRRPLISLPLVPRDDKAQAKARTAVLASLAKRMTLAGTPYPTALDALANDVAKSLDGVDLEASSLMCDRLIGGWRPPKPTLAAVPDFDAFATDWCDGKVYPLLKAKRPKIGAERKSYEAARRSLKKHVFPVLAGVPLDKVSMVEHVEVIVCNLQESGVKAMRQVLSPVNTILAAAETLGLIKRNPIPANWLPPDGDTRVLQFVYPDEDARMMACAKVPAWLRAYFGFTVRECQRPVEPTLL